MIQYIIKIICPDQKGIVAAVATCMAECGINIMDLTQHTAADVDIFMLKSLFEVSDSFNRDEFCQFFESVARKFNMDWQLYSGTSRERVAIMASKTNHCLWELLLKHQDDELACEIPVVISNHPDNEFIAQQFDVPFYSVDYYSGKERAEAEVREILAQYNVDLIVMARFMQILSPSFIYSWRHKIINIHHGFLPAFKGAKPYHQAWHKGVKIIGATAHFANEHLDQGPIITQEVIHVSDRLSIKELMRVGKDIERRTLIQALSLYLEHSIFVYKNRTFILR